MPVMVNPNPASFTLNIDKAFANELVTIRVSDAVERTYINTIINGSSNYTFGERLKHGVYIVYFIVYNKAYNFKIIKQ